MLKPIFIVQMHDTDLINFNLFINSIQVLKRELDDDTSIVIASPDHPQNIEVRKFALQQQVDYFQGDTANVCKRIYDCSQKYQADIVVRVLINWFFLDMNIVRDQIALLEQSEADYVNLPRDFDMRFGADVTTAEFFLKVVETSDQTDPAALFNPWGWAETHHDAIHTETLKNVPVYTNDRFNEIQNKYLQVWPDSHDQSDAPLLQYHFALGEIDSPELARVLDVACGVGNGADLLADRCRSVVGLDIDIKAIQTAKERFNRQNLNFHSVDLMDYNDDKFDAIVSIHTLEHVEAEIEFISACRGLLCDGGQLLLEVPRKKAGPFNLSNIPLTPNHVREYDNESLSALLRRHFSIQAKYGVSRGFYVPVEEARSSLMYHCRAN